MASARTPRGGAAAATDDESSSLNNTTVTKGLLTNEKVAASLSNLGHTPDGQLVYLRSQLSGLGLTSIDVLGQKFANLQSINLDRNRLTSLEGLKGMKHLTVLSAAHNFITAKGITALMGAGRSDDDDYRGPKYGTNEFNPLRRTLQRVILHHNKIEDASCIRGFEFAYEIDVSFNNIGGEIGEKALAHMPSLGVLNLSNNRIQGIDEWGFEGCHALQELDVSQNEISKLNCVSFVSSSLRSLKVSYNSIMECEAFACLKKLADLDLSSNNVYDLGEVAHLSACSALRILNLNGNPVMKEASAAAEAAALNAAHNAANNANNNASLSRGGGGNGNKAATFMTRSGAAAEGGNGSGTSAADGSAPPPLEEYDEETEGAATDEVEMERLQHRLANFQVDASLLNTNNKNGGKSNNTIGKSNGGGGDTKASRDLASLAARKHQQTMGGGGASSSSAAGREVVATPFNEMYLHLSRQKELNMDVANVIRRTAQLLKTSQDHDVASGRSGVSMRFDGTAASGNGTSSYRNGGNGTAQQNATAGGGGGISNTLGGQSGASTILLSPEEEDMLELQQLSADQQTRLKVLWRLPGVALLDGVSVTPEELALAQCLAGGTDRKQRQEAKDRAFGAQQPTYIHSTSNGANGNGSKYGASAAGGGSNAIHSLRHR